MILLSKKTLALIKESQKCRNRLAYILDKDRNTIYRYIDTNSPLLTGVSALNAISEELEIPVNELLEEKA